MKELRNLSDEELMLLVKESNTKAFELLLERFRKPLFNYLYRFTSNYHLSEDLFQETFLRVYKFADRYEARSLFSTYVYRIATNLAINELKRRKIWRMIPLMREDEDGAYEDLDYLKQVKVLQESGTDVKLEQEERMKLVREGLEKLDPKHRAILLLSEFDELPYEEIAKIVDINLGTVKSRIHRAKQSLKDWLKRHELFKDKK